MRILLTLGALLLPSVTTAQTHPCDQSVPSNGSTSSLTTLYAEFCQPQTDNIDAVTVYRNNAATNLTTLDLRTPTPNAAGLMLYRVLIGTVPVGTHSFEISAWNKTLEGVAQESPRSSPFTLTVAAPILAPIAPTRLRVTP